MQKYLQREIVLVPFPFSDLSSIKTRPALVLSKHNNREDLILCAISSQHSGKDEFGIEDTDLQEGVLPIKSYIKYGKIVTLDQKIIRKSVAKLNAASFSKIKDGLIALF